MKTFVGHLLPALLAFTVIGAGPDSTLAKRPGYGGVLPLPIVLPEKAASRLEVSRAPVTRATRGRVLYATERAPRNVDAARASRSKRLCAETVVQSRKTATPNS